MITVTFCIFNNWNVVPCRKCPPKIYRNNMYIDFVNTDTDIDDNRQFVNPANRKCWYIPNILMKTQFIFPSTFVASFYKILIFKKGMKVKLKKNIEKISVFC